MHGKEIIRLLGLGYNGVHYDAHYPDAPEARCSGTLRGELADNYAALADGGFVIDKRPALDRSLSAALRSPLVDTRLAPGEVERFSEKVAGLEWFTDALATVAGNTMLGSLAALANRCPDFHGFDTVSVELYAAWWAKAGARVGQRVGDAIVWSDGVVEPIMAAVPA